MKYKFIKTLALALVISIAAGTNTLTPFVSSTVTAKAAENTEIPKRKNYENYSDYIYAMYNFINGRTGYKYQIPVADISDYSKYIKNYTLYFKYSVNNGLNGGYADDVYLLPPRIPEYYARGIRPFDIINNSGMNGPTYDTYSSLYNEYSKNFDLYQNFINGEVTIDINPDEKPWNATVKNYFYTEYKIPSDIKKQPKLTEAQFKETVKKEIKKRDSFSYYEGIIYSNIGDKEVVDHVHISKDTWKKEREDFLNLLEHDPSSDYRPYTVTERKKIYKVYYSQKAYNRSRAHIINSIADIIDDYSIAGDIEDDGLTKKLKALNLTPVEQCLAPIIPGITDRFRDEFGAQYLYDYQYARLQPFQGWNIKERDKGISPSYVYTYRVFKYGNQSWDFYVLRERIR